MQGAALAPLALLQLLLLLGAVAVEGLSASGRQCGPSATATCPPGDYCSTFENACQPCQHVCDKESHNFEASLCDAQCQDYLLEKLFISRIGRANIIDELQELHTQVTLTMALTLVLTLLLAVVFVVKLVRFQKQHRLTVASVCDKFCFKKKSGNGEKSGQTEASKPDLSLNIQPTMRHGDELSALGNSPDTTITRLPSEDVAPGYAYDNPAMATTPVSTKSRTSPI